MGFSEQLRKARIRTGMSQTQVAEALGVTGSTYCGYETGKRQPDVLKIKKLTEILGTSGDVLLETGFAASDTFRSVSYDDAVSILRRLDGAFLDCAVAQLRALETLKSSDERLPECGLCDKKMEQEK